MKSVKVALVAVSALLGMMLSLQYRSAQETQTQFAGMRMTDMYRQLVQAEHENQQLQQQMIELKESGYQKSVKDELDNLRYQAGLCAVEGPGIIVTLNDSKQKTKLGDNQNLYVVHDEDLLRVINELRAAGAEAIAINDQRLISRSEIRCAGPTVTVNGKMFGPPFSVKAIGDPQLLAGALQLRGGVADTLRYWGIELDIEHVNNVHLPAYSGLVKTDFAKPVKEMK